MSTVAVAGSSGFLGGHLCVALARRGHRVLRLVRRPATASDEIQWDPASGSLDPAVIRAADVVVNLAGSPTVGNPRSRKWAEALRASRVTATRLLADAIAQASDPPAYLAGNGISWYGDHGPAPLTERSDSRGHALLTSVCREWQEATLPAVAAGARVCVLRTAPVIDHRSAPLRQLTPLYRAGLGGPIGSGRQRMPVISLRDWVAAVCFLAEHTDATGPVNLCCPTTPTNGEFTATLAKALGRPSFVRVPAAAIRLATGPMAPELLGSLNTRPAALLDWGYSFADEDVTAVVSSGLG